MRARSVEAEQTFHPALSGVETFAFNDDRLTLSGSGAPHDAAAPML
ncbi:MAG: hypothetical protein GY926_12340 [bacterium]|nr:hypothetical protein [bacterium]MCP4966011.1 hypothetical protein [bacterium]